MNEPNKKILTAVRLVSIVWGVILGWFLAGLLVKIIGVKISEGILLGVKAVNGVIICVIFLSLSRHIAVLLEKIAVSLKKRLSTTPPYKIASVILGVTIGVMLGVLFNAFMKIFSLVLSARIIISLCVSALGAYLGYFVCEKWLVETHIDEQEVIDYNGYILSYGSFFSEKVVYLTQLLNGKIFIVAKTLRRLITLAEEDESAKKALDNYLRLTEYGTVKVIGEGDERAEEDIIVSVAKTKSLKIIVFSASEIKTDEEVKVLSLSEL